MPEVAVIGSGGIGGYVAAELVGAGRDVAMCVRTPFDTLSVEDAGETRTVPMRIETDPKAVGPTRWVLLTTKSGDTDGAAPWLAAMAAPDTTLVVLQNGLGQRQRGEPIAHGAHVLPAVIYCSVERPEPGRIVHHSAARIVVPREGASAGLVALFAGSKFQVEETDDFVTAAWTKLFGNLVANAVTAITIRRTDVLGLPSIKALAGDVLGEALAVAVADGAKVTQADADRILDRIGGHGGGSGTSMLYDRLAGRPLEHRYLTGALLERAERYGVPAPVNRTLLALLDAVSGQDLRAVA